MITDNALERLWRMHRVLTVNEQRETAGFLVEIAVEYSYLTAFTAPSGGTRRRGRRRGRHTAEPWRVDLKAEAEKISAVLYEAERQAGEDDFGPHAFKTLMKRIYQKGLHARRYRRLIE